jgi:UDP:flavonoid glycosyltransferase YjiC (YdhE family)
VGCLLDLGDKISPEDAPILQWLDSLPSRSVVVASFGSITEPRPDILCALLGALESLPSQLHPLFSVTNNKEALIQHCPLANRTRVVPWMPQGAVLAHRAVAAFVSHMGAGSTQQALALGVPMVGIPFAFDQYYPRRGWSWYQPV